MAASTILYIILSGIISLGAALFFYFYKPERSGNLRFILSALRFLVLFSVLLLLVNPTLTQTTYTTLKPKLAIAVDNSQSISHLNAADQVKNLLEKLKANQDLANRFDIDMYAFGSELSNLDRLDFNANQTDIAQVFDDFAKISFI